MQETQNKEKRRKFKTNQEELTGWALSIIPIVGFAIFGLVPLIFSLYIGLNHFKGFRIDNATWAGFDNFKTVLTDKLFWISVRNTVYVILAMLIALVISIVVSVLLSNIKRGKKLFQTVFFIPYVCSLVAVTFMWKWIFTYDYGVLNALLRSLHIIKENVNWLGQESTFMPVMFVILIWSGTGFNIILLSASLTGVNKSCYEAAELDGAGPFVKFFKITLPAISPTIFYLVITGIIGSMQEFSRFQAMVGTAGGPNYAGLTIVSYLYRKLDFTFGIDIGIATSVGWILALAIGIVVAINFWGSKRWVSYDE